MLFLIHFTTLNLYKGNMALFLCLDSAVSTPHSQPENELPYSV